MRKATSFTISITFLLANFFGGAAWHWSSVQVRATSTATRRHAEGLREKLKHPGGFAEEREAHFSFGLLWR